MTPTEGTDASRSVAARHLELHLAAVVVRMVAVLDDALGRGLVERDDVERRFPFLEQYTDHLAEIAGGRAHRDDPQRYTELADQLVVTTATPPPLARLASTGLGGAAAVGVVAMAALVERDVRFGAVVASMQGAETSRRPCIGLLALVLGTDVDAMSRTVETLAAAGVVLVDDPDEPRAEQVVRLPLAVLRVVEGAPAAMPGVAVFDRVGAPDLHEIMLPGDVRARVDSAGTLLGAARLDAVVLRGAPGTGRRTVMRTIAAGHGRGLLVAEVGEHGAERARTAGALAVLTGSMYVAAVEPGVGQMVSVDRPLGVGAIGVVTGRSGAVSVAGADRVAVVELQTPDAATRRRFWQRTGVFMDDAVLNAVSRRYGFTGGVIERVAEQAASIAGVDGRDLVAVDDVRQAAQDQGRQRLESLATLLEPLDPSCTPILGGSTAAEYEALVLRARHREALGAAIGGATGRQVSRGVKAMFAGPSGTGKTMTAKALGARLDLDVYRADLAALVDKYIGETERRLDELFRRAEELDVVLLIDEGDALMTRRTDVHSSNDRYANLETDYLLQRLETYEGIVVITTNAAHLIDPAFGRRLDVTVTFAAPGVTERRRIWDLHLPKRHGLSEALLDDVADRCRLSGGQIRNAVVHAALVALDRAEPMGDDDAIAAIEREYTNAGQPSPMRQATPVSSPFARMMASP